MEGFAPADAVSLINNMASDGQQPTLERGLP